MPVPFSSAERIGCVELLWWPQLPAAAGLGCGLQLGSPHCRLVATQPHGVTLHVRYQVGP